MSAPQYSLRLLCASLQFGFGSTLLNDERFRPPGSMAAMGRIAVTDGAAYALAEDAQK